MFRYGLSVCGVVWVGAALLLYPDYFWRPIGCCMYSLSPSHAVDLPSRPSVCYQNKLARTYAHTPARAHTHIHIHQEVSLDSVDSTLWALEKDTETDDEIMEGDPLDLGEVAAQMLALCVDPYAKHPDFVSPTDAGDGGGAGAGAGTGGFAAGRFGMPAEGEDEVLDVEAMRAFFDADD